MSISRFAARRPVAIAMVAVALVVFGIISTSRLALDWMPSLRLQVVGIVTVYPGAEPYSVEQQITVPVESAIATVSGLKNLESYSMENLSVVVATFHSGVNGYEAVHSINANLAPLAASLPSGSMKPVVAKVDPRMFPLLTVGVTGTDDLAEMTSIAENELRPALEQVLGVAKVSVVGAAHPEVTVYFDSDALRANNLTPYNIYELISQQNALVPAGAIIDNDTRYNVRVGNPLKDADDVKNLVIGHKRTTGMEAGGFGALIPQQLFIKDVARVVSGVSPQQGFARVNGEPAIALHIFKDTGENSVRVSQRIEQAITQLNADQNSRVKLQILTDQSQFIVSALGALRGSATIGALLAVLVLFLFLTSWRSIVVITLAIPLSIVVALVLMYSAKLSLNMMTLGGLALGIGMLVDNAIVVLENIIRFQRMGKGPLEAAEEGANEVVLAISASTLTTIVVFLPLAYLQSTAGQWFRDMALTITFSLCASLLVAITIVPAASARLLRRIRPSQKHNKQTVSLGNDLNMDIIEYNWMSWVQKKYLHQLHRTLQRPWPVLLLVGLLITGGVYAYKNMAAELLPSVDGGVVNLTLTMPAGTPISSTDAVTRRIEEAISLMPEVDSVWSQAGQQDDNLINLLYSSGSNVAQVHAGLIPLANRRRAENIANDISERINSLDLAGGFISVSAERMTDAMGEEYQVGATIQLRGPNLDDLEKQAAILSSDMKDAGGFIDITTSVEQKQPELLFTVDRTKALIGQMTTGLIGLTLRGALTGLEATQIQKDGKSIPVVLRPAPEQVANLDKLLELPLQGMATAGQVVPPVVKFGKVVQSQVTNGPVTIEHRDRWRTVSVHARLADIDLTTAGLKAQTLIDNLNLPTGMSARLAGIHDTIAEASKELTWALALAVALVFMVMAAQFESLRYPFIVMFSVPTAVAGGLIMLWLTGQRLGVPSMMGLIILVGVSVNNAIVLVDAINRYLAEGAHLEEALLTAARNRIRPILMTSLTTIFGLIPLALSRGEGSEMQIPLAIGFMGGMISSTVLTLFFIPVMYKGLYRLIRKPAAPTATVEM